MLSRLARICQEIENFKRSLITSDLFFRCIITKDARRSSHITHLNAQISNVKENGDIIQAMIRGLCKL